jgi:PAS domain S-box-containing protein
VPCVSKEGTIAVMALGAKDTGEPLNSEDMALLEAVAGQVATAFENGRLYHQLQLKAGELDRERSFNENIIESLDDGLLVAGLDDRVVRWNPALESLYGVSRTAAVGRRLDELFDASFLGGVAAARRERETDEIALYRLPLMSRHADGPRALLVNIASAPLRTGERGRAGTMLIVEDVTSRVQLEEQLQISEKMASIGLLAAGVAHEVNTPLTGISSFTQMLLESADPDDPRTKLLEKIERQTFRAARIVNGLLNLARPAQTDRAPVDLHAVINDVLALLEHQFRTANLQVRKDVAADTPVVLAIEHKLQQVFLNLFLNARDAMPKGGWLSITTRLEDGRAVVEVGDTGAGIQSENLSRIYDPFFTTKPIGQGTGLGLSITYGIVREHDGVITCESTEGKGTVFRLVLPLADAPPRATSLDEQVRARATGSAEPRA